MKITDDRPTELSVRSTHAIRNFFGGGPKDVTVEMARQFIEAGGLARAGLGIGKLAVKEIEAFAGLARHHKPRKATECKPTKQQVIDALVAALEEVRYAIGSDDGERNWIAINCIDSALALARS